MSQTQLRLYLPLTSKQLDLVCTTGLNSSSLSNLSLHNICTLLVIQNLPRWVNDPTCVAKTEKLLANLIDTSLTVRETDIAAFVQEVVERIDIDDVSAARDLLDSVGISLLDQDVVNAQRYLNNDGSWNYEFRLQYEEEISKDAYRYTTSSGESVRLTLPQSRLIRGFRANIDDHLHIQGYAGTGKTHLLRDMVELLRASRIHPSSILVLAQTPAQLRGIEQRLGTTMEGIHWGTFGQIAKRIIPEDLTRNEYLSMQRRRDPNSLDRDAFSRTYDIQWIAELSPAQVAQICWGMVANFCSSGDAEVGEQHIPYWATSKGKGGRSLEPQDKAMLAHYATCLWNAILAPSKEFSPPLKEYHRIKYAALEGFILPKRYSHVVIDESHDLTKPMLQILDRSPQAVISLGDEYQNLVGAPAERAVAVRQRNIVTSVRSGRKMESVVNPIIMNHPGNTKEPYEGSQLKQMTIHYYNEPGIPQEPTAFLVSDEWGLFEWVQRFASAGIEYKLLGDPTHLDKFVQDCIELHHRGIRARHGALFRYPTWDSVRNAGSHNRSISRVDRLLERGYDHEQWSEARSLCRGRGISGRYVIGQISDAKNREFNTVMITPDVIDACWDTEGLCYTAGSALYVAVTRPLYKLIAPIALREWIEEMT